MKVLLIDGGGRGDALARKIAQSPRLTKLYVAPGNAGTATLGENVPIKATDVEFLLSFALKEKIDLTVVGQDDSLGMGIVDLFKLQGLKIFGPLRSPAQIETSKVFAKRLMVASAVPTARFMVFEKKDYEIACDVVRYIGAPIVIKVDGLALGKGSYVCKDVSFALDVLHKIMIENVHEDAGDQVIIEEYLPGPEFSMHAICDGNSHILFPPSRDHKALFDNDQGPNTGGMGAIAPVPSITHSQLIESSGIVKETLKAIHQWTGSRFVGCLYPGFKVSPSGLQVLEFNARFGDPETQVYMRLLKTDILDIFEACIDGQLEKIKVEWHPGYAVCVNLVSLGYPGKYKKGLPITGIYEAEQIPDVVVFHAGTVISEDGVLKTSGGRVLSVTGVGATLEKAIEKTYAAVHCIDFEGKHYRKDIGRNS